MVHVQILVFLAWTYSWVFFHLQVLKEKLHNSVQLHWTDQTKYDRYWHNLIVQTLEWLAWYINYPRVLLMYVKQLLCTVSSATVSFLDVIVMSWRAESSTVCYAFRLVTGSSCTLTVLPVLYCIFNTNRRKYDLLVKLWWSIPAIQMQSLQSKCEITKIH